MHAIKNVFWGFFVGFFFFKGENTFAWMSFSWKLKKKLLQIYNDFCCSTYKIDKDTIIKFLCLMNIHRYFIGDAVGP